jgi:hypothetical protein
MNRSSGPCKTANLPDSIHQQLNMYALAASVAGVGISALAHPAEGKIVYKPAHVVIGYHGVRNHSLDLNSDGFADVSFLWHFNLRHCGNLYRWNIRESLTEIPLSGAGVEGVPPAALPRGTPVGDSQTFQGVGGLMALQQISHNCPPIAMEVTGSTSPTDISESGSRFMGKHITAGRA